MNQLQILSKSLVPDPERLPRPADAESAARGRQRWVEAGERADDPEFAEYARALDCHPAGARLLDAVFGNSPFLSQCVLTDADFARALFRDGAETAFERALHALGANAPPSSDIATVMRVLRRAQQRVALLVAVADISGSWQLE